MKRLFIILALLIFVSILVIASGGYCLNSSLSTPKEHDKAGTYIVIEKGSTPSQIVAKLAAEGILATPMPTNFYLRTFGNPAGLKAGEYRFPSPITPLQALAILEKGEERSTRLVIPEGFTRFDIAKRMAEYVQKNSPTAINADETQILSLMNDTSAIKDVFPEAKNLEGYMYPSTYDLAP